MALNTSAWNRIRYTLYAPIYDMTVRVLDGYRGQSIGMLGIGEAERVLIVGAGTGLDLPHIPAHAHVTATDITPGMLAKLRQRAQGLGMDVDALVMDGHALAFPDQSFECVILHLIVAVIPNSVQCMMEVERVLKPGGRAVVFDKFLPDGQQPSVLRRGLNLVTGALFSEINRQIGPIIAHTGLRIAENRPAAFGGTFRMILLEKDPD